MNFLKYFFRSQQDDFVFEQFGPAHWLLLLFYILGMAFIIKKSFGIDEKKNNKKFLAIMAKILLIDQIVLYSWQFGSGYFRLDLSLPLYHCRLAVWALIIGILLDDRMSKIIGAYLGFLGSTVAMSLPDLYSFAFPHYTNIQFFLVHILMGWIVVDFIFVEGLFVRKNELKRVLMILNSFNIFLLLFNISLRKIYEDINYGYLLRPPVSVEKVIPTELYIIAVFVLFNLVILLFYKLFNCLNRRLVSVENKEDIF
ncbi:MAG: TIGR02206 family membrane protein [Tissierellia bacterium]|nr:TIGR02206 family membrane protein [Tissierellia bacterium]